MKIKWTDKKSYFILKKMQANIDAPSNCNISRVEKGREEVEHEKASQGR